MSTKVIRVELDLPTGERVRRLEDDRFSCPVCGTRLQLKRSKVADFMEDKNGVGLNVYRRTYYCPACGYKLHSQTWRPYGENPCCQEQLARMNPRVINVVDTWVERDDNLLIFKRVESFTCTCGTYYEWPEVATAPYDRCEEE